MHVDVPTTAAHTRSSFLPVWAVTGATFLVVTSEMMPVGVLSPLAASLQISHGLAGMSLTVTGLIAAVVSTLAPILARRVDRRAILVGFMVALAAANALTACAPNFATLAGARVLLGIAMGMVWGLAAGLGPRLVSGARVGRATTLIFSGVAIASVLGVPLGTAVADFAGWRAAFWGLAALGIVSSVLLRALLPPLPAAESVRLGTVFGVLRTPGVAWGLAITGLVVLAHFSGYTYVRPVLESAFGIAASAVAGVLLVYGIAGVAGNFVLGAVAGRSPRFAVLLAVGAVAAATWGIAAISEPVSGLVFALVVVWGLGYGGVSVSTQSWTAAADPGRVEASAAIWAGVFNASIAVGSAIGGIAVNVSGPRAAMLLAGLLAVAAWGLAGATRPVPRAARSGHPAAAARATRRRARASSRPEEA